MAFDADHTVFGPAFGKSVLREVTVCARNPFLPMNGTVEFLLRGEVRHKDGQIHGHAEWLRALYLEQSGSELTLGGVTFRAPNGFLANRVVVALNSEYALNIISSPVFGLQEIAQCMPFLFAHETIAVSVNLSPRRASILFQVQINRQVHSFGVSVTRRAGEDGQVFSR